ncbi:MAG TPA: 4Fe-4S binding protein, partial [Methanomassiliicoccales archaeon]|nr:4Fe-4S binding protein [Methanomassiliicoccales archaeon]
APGDSGVPGVFLCGSALSGHRDGSETQAARAAAVSLARELRSPAPRTPKARVDRERCSKCLTCLRLCPYGAPSLEHGEVVVSVERCQGCGLCVAMCPGMAIEMPPSDLRAEVGATRMGGMG